MTVPSCHCEGRSPEAISEVAEIAMKVITTVAEFRRARDEVKGSLGFVPTMGYLHEGHLSLVRWARAENEVVAASIFVNPTQFGPHEDFVTYPRDQDRDLAMLKNEGCHLVFMPPVEEMYPPGHSTHVEVGGVTERLEGAHRLGHFRGVATVVTKLFGIVQPTRAYFGQKDAQQVVVIRKMTADLNLPVEVVTCPTIREADGLAMSSRNVYLGLEERQAASVLYRSLQLAQERFVQGERDATALRRRMEALIRAEPRAQIDYVSIAHPDTLEELGRVEAGALVSLAVHIGKTRLIDNIILPPE